MSSINNLAEDCNVNLVDVPLDYCQQWTSKQTYPISSLHSINFCKLTGESERPDENLVAAHIPLRNGQIANDGSHSTKNVSYINLHKPDLNLPVVEDGLSSGSDPDTPHLSTRSVNSGAAVQGTSKCDLRPPTCSAPFTAFQSRCESLRQESNEVSGSLVSPPLVRDIWGIVNELKQALLDTNTLPTQTDDSFNSSSVDPRALVSEDYSHREGEHTTPLHTNPVQFCEHRNSLQQPVLGDGICEKFIVKANIEEREFPESSRSCSCASEPNNKTPNFCESPVSSSDLRTHHWTFLNHPPALDSSSEDELTTMPAGRSQFNQMKPTLIELAGHSNARSSATMDSNHEEVISNKPHSAIVSPSPNEASKDVSEGKTKHEDFERNTDTDKLLQEHYQSDKPLYIPELKQEARFQAIRRKRAREVSMRHPDCPDSLINGVLFSARYLGSTQLLSERQPTRNSRMFQAQEAVNRIKAPDGEDQPSVSIELFISTDRITILNQNLEEILIDHELRLISYIADIGDIFVLMARRPVVPLSASNKSFNGEPATANDNTSVREDEVPDTHTNQTGRHIRGLSKSMFDETRKPDTKLLCHVLESSEARLIAQSVGHAFQLAYLDFLRESGVEDLSSVNRLNYDEVLNQQEIFCDELTMFTDKQRHKKITIPKQRGEPLGVVIVASGWGSLLPTALLANMNPVGPAARCGQLNIGNHIISVNDDSLVGLPINACQQIIKNCRSKTSVRLVVVDCPPVVEVLIRRPSLQYQLGFSVQDGIICSLLRGGIAERGGIRVDHRIIEINGESVVAVPHDRIVHLLATSVGEIHIRTMPTSVFRLLTGQDVPNYI